MKLKVFDFDGTLVYIACKPHTTEQANKVGWNGKDWWGSECSLKKFLFHANVKKEFEEARKDTNTRTALLTGRRGVIAWRVREILLSENLVGKRIIPKSNKVALKHFKEENNQGLHEEYFMGDFITEEDYPKNKKNKPISSTLIHKKFIIENRLMDKNITRIELWDDRRDHFHPMMDLIKSLLSKWSNLNIAILHQVFPQENVENPYIIDHCFKKNNQEINYTTGREF